MELTQVFNEMMSVVSPVLILSGMVSLTIGVIVMCINMLIDAFTGKGFRIGLR